MGLGFSAACQSDIESFIIKWMSENHIPGASVAIVDTEGDQFASGFGTRSPDCNESVTPDTLFGFGSCTKPVTALAVMQCIDNEYISIEDQVDAYLPHLSTTPGDPITIGELLTHTSGLPSDGIIEPLVARPLLGGPAKTPLSSDDDFRRYVEGAFDRRITSHNTLFYNNTGYILLGKIIENVTGESYAQYVRKQILNPLEMDRSTFKSEEFEARSNCIAPYIQLDGQLEPTSFPSHRLIYAFGGLATSVTEFGEFIRLILNEGTVDNETLLCPDLLEDMYSPVASFGTRFDGSEIHYGYGMMVESFLDQILVSHNGTIGVSNAWFGVLPESDVGVVVACTLEPEIGAAAAGKGILALLHGENPDTVVPKIRLIKMLEEVTGTYENYRGLGSVLVDRVGGPCLLSY